jgi:cytosine/adenosine deaminase-related metal-dependent hydrolase
MSSPSRRSFLGAGAGVAAGFAARPASAQVPLSRLQKAQRILLKGGIVLSLDSKVGDFERADVLIEGQKIAAIAPSIPASSAVTVDATGMIAMPGFVDTHHHQYETLMRSILSDGNLGLYSDPPKNYISVIQGILTPASPPP